MAANALVRLTDRIGLTRPQRRSEAIDKLTAELQTASGASFGGWGIYLDDNHTVSIRADREDARAELVLYRQDEVTEDGKWSRTPWRPVTFEEAVEVFKLLAKQQELEAAQAKDQRELEDHVLAEGLAALAAEHRLDFDPAQLDHGFYAYDEKLQSSVRYMATAYHGNFGLKRKIYHPDAYPEHAYVEGPEQVAEFVKDANAAWAAIEQPRSQSVQPEQIREQVRSHGRGKGISR